jgi:hypothetical protein
MNRVRNALCDPTWRPDETSNAEAQLSNDPSALDCAMGLERLERDEEGGRHRFSFSDAGRAGPRA